MTRDETERDVGTARVVETWLDEGVQRLPQGDDLPDDVFRRVVAGIEETPQLSGRRSWREWLGLPAPDGLGADRRRLSLAGSAIAAIVVLLVLGANLVILDRPTATSVGHLIVTADGVGGFRTLAAAVAAADDGDVIAVRPGHYTESIVIDKPIMLVGDGPVDEIVISAPAEGPSFAVPEVFVVERAGYAILVRGVDAEITGLTFRGGPSRLVVDGGSARLDGLVFDDVGELSGGIQSRQVGALVIDGGASPVVRGSTFAGAGDVQVFGRSDALLEGNAFSAGASLSGEFGPAAVVRNNRFTGSAGTAIELLGSAPALIEANEISGTAIGIAGTVDADMGTLPRIVGNTISETTIGIRLAAETGGEVRDNVMRSNGQAISLSGSTTTVAGNTLDGNGIGITIDGGAPLLDGNAILDGSIGIRLQGASSPRLIDNIVCGNETNVALSAGATRPDVSGNEICPDGAPAGEP